jgi:ubiquinol-cytochrome c reductase subunit 6
MPAILAINCQIASFGLAPDCVRLVAVRAGVQADVEVVDPKPRIEKECHSSCTKDWTKYEACVKRITAKGSGTCEPWAFDYWTCVDKCTAPRLFSVLK